MIVCMESLMRRVFLCLAATGALTCQQATAQMQCLSPDERAAFEVQALRSELVVLATGCSDDAQYNAFVRRYQPELQANERAIDAWFKRHYGRKAQFEHDKFVTEMVNDRSDIGSRLGSEFCPRNGMVFQEAMALHNAGELPAFAAGQDLLPSTMGICAEEVAQAPVRKASKHR